jgi:phosphotriesterase-related protein
MRIETVLGPIKPEQLGVTSSHDHLITVGGGEVRADQDLALPSIENAVKELSEFRDAGGRAMVEMGVIGIGRATDKVIEVARRVGDVHVIAATGFHRAAYFEETHWIFHYTVEEIADLVEAEVREGIEVSCYEGPLVKRCSAKAGVLKLGTGYNYISPADEKLFKAIAIVQKRTGAPISTHTERGTMAFEQLDLLAREKVDLGRVIIGHIDRYPDFWYHREIARRGAFLEYDGASRAKYWPDGVLIEVIKQMVGAGFQKQMLLGMDNGRASYWKSYGGGPGFAYLFTRYVPRLMAAGVPQDAIDDMLVNNPRRAFAF